MASPFPGMDPYLEDPAIWEEFHHVFITECMYQLSDRLPDRYLANLQVRAGREEVGTQSQNASEVREAFIEIVRRLNHDLVTSVEPLSPWNKFGDGAEAYRSTRRNLLDHGIHVVEVDLMTRGGRRESSPSLPESDYVVYVFRADPRRGVDQYPWGVRQTLPHVPVPLRAPDPDAVLDLAAVVTSAYDRGRYARKLRYGQPPPASLGPADLAWAAKVAGGVHGRE